ncbi:hypothetical protein DA2_2425 [Desulfovibrio sp. A2]|nr:hypothetical protein DA2_2425 [Desulfovibrio sp. A2]
MAYSPPPPGLPGPGFWVFDGPEWRGVAAWRGARRGSRTMVTAGPSVKYVFSQAAGKKPRRAG